MKSPLYVDTVKVPIDQCFLDCPDYYVLPGFEDYRVPHPNGHAGYQRDTWQESRKWCVDKADHFDPMLYDPIDVSQRRINNKQCYAIIDGGGRWYIAQLRKFGSIGARIHKGLDTQKEAALFVKRQTEKRKLTTVHNFHGMVSAGDKLCGNIDKTMKAAGFHVGTGKHGYQRIPALINAYDLGVLSQVLHHLKYSYSGDLIPAIPGVFFSGLSLLEAATKGKFDIESFRAMLAKTPPVQVQTKIKNDLGGIRLHPGDAPKYFAMELANLYNYRRKIKRIDVNSLRSFSEKCTLRTSTKKEVRQ